MLKWKNQENQQQKKCKLCTKTIEEICEKYKKRKIYIAFLRKGEDSEDTKTIKQTKLQVKGEQVK